MKYQLWSKDEYGTTSIINTFDSIEEASNKGATLVTAANFGNSLSSSEQMRTIEAYMVEFVDELSEHTYAGFTQNKHMLFKDGAKTSLVEKKAPMNIYIGSKFAKNKDKLIIESRHYMKDEKGNLITNLDSDVLEGKTVYFIRPIEA